MEWFDELRDEFPAVKNQIYFDMAFSNPVAASMIRAISQFWEKAGSGIIDKKAWISQADGLRGKIAELINGHPEGVAFTKNTSEGINIVAQGLPWKEGEHVIVYDQEHASNFYPWLNLRKRKVNVDVISALDNRLPISLIRSHITKYSKVIAISSVQYCTGYRADLTALGSLCRKKGIRLVVDGIQSLGSLCLDANEAGIDALACGGHKGLLGPHGVGFLYCSQSLLKELSPVYRGPSPALRLNREDDFNLEVTNPQDARRLEYGYLNFAGLCGIEKGIDIIKKYGIDRIEKRVLSLARLLEAGLSKQSYCPISFAEEAERSGLVVARVSDPAGFRDYMRQRGIVISLMDAGVIRFSPYAYNTEEEVDQILKACHEYKNKG